MKITWLTLFTIISIHLYASHGKLHSPHSRAAKCLLEATSKEIDIINEDNLHIGDTLRNCAHEVLHNHEHIRKSIDELIIVIKSRSNRWRKALVRSREKTEKSIHKHSHDNEKVKVLLLGASTLNEAITAVNIREKYVIEVLNKACTKVEHKPHECIPTAKWILEELIRIRDTEVWENPLKLEIHESLVERLKECGIPENDCIEINELIKDNARNEHYWKSYTLKRRDVQILSVKLEIESCEKEY